MCALFRVCRQILSVVFIYDARRVLKMAHGFALVEYDTIFADEAGSSKLWEWFRIPPPAPHANVAALTAATAADEEHELHPDLNFQLRPKPPSEVREGVF